MNFNQIVEETEKLLRSRYLETTLKLFLLAMSKLETVIFFQQRTLHDPNWRQKEISVEDYTLQSLFNDFRYALKHLGGDLSLNYEEGRKTEITEILNDLVWDGLTRVLTAFRWVLVQNFHIRLPEARVVSAVAEMVESGKKELFRNKDGQLCIRFKDPVTIRIIKKPAISAPPAFLEKFVGLTFSSAYQKPDGDFLVDCYEVLTKVPPEAAEWLADHYQVLKYLFRGYEAEIVPDDTISANVH